MKYCLCFKGAKIQALTHYNAPMENSLYLSMEEQAEIAFRVYRDGALLFSDTQTGAQIQQAYLPLLEDEVILKVAQDPTNPNLLAAGLSSGRVLVFQQEYKASWPDNQRVITPSIQFPFGKAPITVLQAGQPIDHLSIANSDEQLLIGASAQNTDSAQTMVVMKALVKEEDFLMEAVTIREQNVNIPLVKGAVHRLLLTPDQRWLLAITKNNQLSLMNIANINKTGLHSTTALTEQGHNVTEVSLLLGGLSLLVGDSSGDISQWFLVREGESKKLQKIRSFTLDNQPIIRIVPEGRRKGFVAVDKAGQLGLFYTTSHRTLLNIQLVSPSIKQMAISPRGNFIMTEGRDGVRFFKVDNEHPEISWSALWEKVWYESYDQPEFIWQSSAANTDFEGKLSLTPLAFGTLKAAFYAMLLAAPLAIFGAIYTAYFMAPVMRRKVKPMIEMMEALPTVILGFLAGLWLAPLIESQLAGIFALFLFLPIGILLFAFLWDHFPAIIRHKIPDGWQAALLIPVIILCGWGAMNLSSPIEQWFFGGSLRHWLTQELGIPYDQRNALVVGLAMGFAVIPTIFSIAEDAIFSVPKHLSYGSLALGATPWQTLTGVVLLTASPGIFSALMIGMGRAVGETMIVLMATGNTPIMDANIFEGMRTLAANIAVEMPESEVGSSHYRILFLAALVLFSFTFIVNTLAETIRHRLRKKYSTL